MSDIKKLVGSLCIFGFDGTSLPGLLKKMIEEWSLGGVILFRRNIESKEQVKDLIKEVKSCSKEKMFVSVDHEGGRVFRLPPPFTQIPSAREIATSRLLPLLTKEGLGGRSAFDWGVLMGQELREVGFNLNYAPVLDVDSNPDNPIIGDRAFGVDPQTVIENGLALIGGLRSEKIIPCGKHFPGHGDTSKDSHLELPRVDQPLERLEEIELAPFRAAVNKQIEMLMTAHVLYPALDGLLPATLSPKILTNLLRNEMAYEGLIISDDLNMKAISDAYGLGEAARLFLEAGGDIPLICRGEEAEWEVLEYLEKCLRDKELNMSKVEKSCQRVRGLKQKYL